MLAPRSQSGHYADVTPLLLAQSLLEYGGLGSSGSAVSDSLSDVGTRLVDSLRDVDQKTWLMIGGALLVLAFLTRRKR